MQNEDINVRIVRLRRVLGATQRRHARRHNRSSTIWYGYRAYYGRYPGRRARWQLCDEWDNKHRLWAYEEAYCLELEAAILMNWITVLLNDATRLRGPIQGRGVLRKLA